MGAFDYCSTCGAIRPMSRLVPDGFDEFGQLYICRACLADDDDLELVPGEE